MQKEVLLIMSNVVIPVIVGAVCAVVFAVLGFVLGVAHRRKTAEKEIGSATQEATKIINNALAEAEASKKEKVLEAKDEVHKLRSDADRDIRERRNEVQRQEKRLNQREEYLDKKADSLEAKNDKISEKQKELENKLLEVDGIKKSQFDMLERISGLTQEEAKNQLLASLEEELDTEKSKKILEYEQMTRDQSEVLAREIIGTASLNRKANRMRHRAEFGISLKKAYWGCGAASAMTERILAFARETGVEQVNLEVRSDNKRAIALYEKFGFRRLCTFPGFFKINGELIDFDLMNLSLCPAGQDETP